MLCDICLCYLGIHYCSECQQHYCSSCVEVHKKIKTTSHHFVEVVDNDCHGNSPLPLTTINTNINWDVEGMGNVHNCVDNNIYLTTTTTSSTTTTTTTTTMLTNNNNISDSINNNNSKDYDNINNKETGDNGIKNCSNWFCPSHPKELIKSYCLTCKRFTCEVCNKKHDTKHEIMFVDDYFEFEKKKILKCSINHRYIMERIDHDVTKIIVLIKKMSTKNSKINRVLMITRDEMMKQISDSFDEQIKLLTTRSQEKVNDMYSLKHHLMILKDELQNHIQHNTQLLYKLDRYKAFNMEDYVEYIRPEFDLSFADMLLQIPETCYIPQKNEFQLLRPHLMLGHLLDKKIQIMNKLSKTYEVTGATIYKSKLYLCFWATQNIYIFNTVDLMHYDTLYLPNIAMPYDVLIMHEMMYIAEMYTGFIHRISMESNEYPKPLNVKASVISLSQGYNNNLLVLCCDQRLILIYNTSGQVKKTMKLPTYIRFPTYATVTKNKTYLVTSAGMNPCVYLLDYTSRCLHKYNPDNKQDLLMSPRYLAMDEGGNIVVCDYGNQRLVMMDSNLNFICVLPLKQFQCNPAVVCFEGGCEQRFYVLTHGCKAILKVQLQILT